MVLVSMMEVMMRADIYRTIATPTRKPASPALGGISCT